MHRRPREGLAVREAHQGLGRHARTYAHEVIGALPVSAINTDLVLQVLRPIWERIPDTASRVRGRIEMVLDACAARGLREETNPARWAVLKHLLPKPSKVKPKEHYEALPFEQVGAFMAELRELDGPAPRALEFLGLTASRAGEGRLAAWDEVQGNACESPEHRMKAARKHHVALLVRRRELIW